MTIASKLTYLNDTKTILRDAINRAGGSLTVDTPFREYADWIKQQEATLSLDFINQQYVAKDSGTKFPDRAGFNNIVTFTRASSGGRFNSAGVYEQVAANVPRFDYDPVTLQPRGFLIEEQRTNLLLQSANFANASWIKASGVSFGTDGQAAPDGSLLPVATVIGANNHEFLQVLSAPLSVGQAYTLTVYLRAKGGAFPFQIAYYDGTTALNTIVVTPTSALERYTFTFTPTVTATFPRIRFLGFANGSGGQQVYVWGAQLELGSFPTSYIPTTTSQVTRAADVASVNTLSPWFNAAAGTFVMEHNAPAARQLLSSGANLLLTSQGSGKIAVSYTGTGSLASYNGGAPVAGPALTFSTALKLFGGPSSFMNAHGKRLDYYPRALTGPELQELTA